MSQLFGLRIAIYTRSLDSQLQLKLLIDCPDDLYPSTDGDTQVSTLMPQVWQTPPPC